MRIGVYTEVYKPVLNGVVVSIECFRAQLEALGHEVYIFTPSHRFHTSPSEHNAHVLPFLSLPLPTDTPYRFTTPFRLHGRPPELDLIHAHSPFNTGLLAWHHARRENLPLVYTYHTRLVDYSHYLPTPETVSRRYLRWVSRSFSNLADRVVVPSGPIRDLLVEYGVYRPIDVVPTTVQLSSAEASSRLDVRVRHGIAAECRLLLSVGRLAREKNFETLLTAFARVARHVKVHLLLVGDGPQREALEALVQELGIADQTTFVGQVEHEEVAAYYAAADLFVFASLTETQGLVLDEALASGIPVLAVAEGGTVDLLARGQGVLGVPPGDRATGLLEAFSGALGQLLEQPDRLDELTRQARAQAASSSVADSAGRLLGVYQAALAGFEIRPVRIPSFLTRAEGRVGRRL